MCDEVIVIGAGIIGISIALKLQSSGYSVRVLDRKGVAEEASKANAGAFAFTDVEPLATPGIMRKAPKWLFDPKGPLSIPPAYAVNIIPWLLRFWRASWPDRYEAALAAQTKLMHLSKSALERQITDVQGQSFMLREGQLQLYEGEKEFRASLPGWELRRRYGVEFELLETPEAISSYQPGVHSRFTHAAFTPSWMNTVDPGRWARHLAQVFSDRNGSVENAEVKTIDQRGDKIVVTTASDTFSPSRVIIAAGAWSRHLTRKLGDNLPLETERGYNTTLPSGAFELRTHLTFGGHGFVVTRIRDGIRIGGSVELGGLKLPPNYKRADILLDKAEKFLPGLNTNGGKRWMGFRPSMPDSLPVISFSSRTQNVIYAFGHGHLGLTQSAGTAEIVKTLITGDTPEIPLEPYSVTRF